MLKKEVGEIVRAEDVTSQSIVTRLQYGYTAIKLLDNLFNVAIKDMRYEDVDLTKLSLETPYKPAVAALKDSFLFRLVDSIDDTAQINISKGLLPKKIRLNVDSYIQRYCNKYFKYRKMQLDCEYMLQAINSDFRIFSESNNIITNFSYDSTINLRTFTRQKPSLIMNEINALKRIKEEFTNLFSNIKSLMYELECIAYRLRDKQIVNNTECELDI